MFKALFAIGVLLLSHPLLAKPIQIVAAENFYGTIAQQIGGPYVKVTNIMNNPNQDPHLFSNSSSVAKAVSEADLVVYNGIGYDPWIINLMQTASKTNRATLIIADLVGKKMGDNPHIWYDPATMPAFAKALKQMLVSLDPEHQEQYAKNLEKFNKDYKALTDLISEIKNGYQGAVLIATEPVFNYMAEALGMKVLGQSFQLSIMNDTEPSAKDIADFENNLSTHAAKVLIYNSQVSNPITERMQNIATQAKIPVVGVSETEPSNMTYIKWMQKELIALQRALKKG